MKFALPKSFVPGVCASLIAVTATIGLQDASEAKSGKSLQEKAEAKLSTQMDNYTLYRKLIGRLDDKQYFVSVRANLFAFEPGKPSIPLATVMGLWTYKMVDDPAFGGHFIRGAYCGTFVPFGTSKPVSKFVNPITGKEITPQISKRSGAILIQGRRPTGIWYRTENKGNVWDRHAFPFAPSDGPAYPWQIVGDEIYMTENLVDFKTDKPRYEDMTWSANLADLMDDKRKFVPSSRIFGSTTRGAEFPFFEFGDKATTTFIVFHATGRKVETLAGVPQNLIDFTKKECPTHLGGKVFEKSIAEVLAE